MSESGTERRFCMMEVESFVELFSEIRWTVEPKLVARNVTKLREPINRGQYTGHRNQYRLMYIFLCRCT